MGVAWLPGPEQINAAARLYARMPYWQTADAAMVSLAERFPTFSKQACLLKVAVINQLYYTNVYAVGRMAQHISDIMSSHDRPSDGPDLVEDIAALPGPGGVSATRKHTSFASKFAHFFIDAEAHPICDKYAAAMLGQVLNGNTATTAETKSYSAYVAKFLRLKGSLAGLRCESRQLDRWLWLAGLYRHWKMKPDTGINAEARSLFQGPTDDARADLNALLPGSIYKACGGKL